MLEVRLKNAAKRFQYDWIFRNLDLHVSSNTKIAITGSNGSGKSTLLKCLAGTTPFTEGSAEYHFQSSPIQESELYQKLAITAPYMELPEEFTLFELLQFHFEFKVALEGMDINDMMETMYLTEAKNKQITYFSSGMKQRLKLGLCFFSKVPMLILDEPTSNLDKRGVEWYLSLVEQFGKNRTIFIGSNEPKEYSFCNQTLHIEDYKLQKSL
ncbi:ABC transporter ATP-binding protein [Echinicola shivajiensis]|uniref:ABC transporter ATP-binding protein n=1 Tax=Echinicola shivajiensis TaxID=1035916 RepID=UPI001BFC2F55|nr:ATP-binding cassette domain-containing protein [Echinicola shivajiensis]